MSARDFFSELNTELVELDLLIAKYEARIHSLAKRMRSAKSF